MLFSIFKLQNHVLICCYCQHFLQLNFCQHLISKENIPVFLFLRHLNIKDSSVNLSGNAGNEHKHTLTLCSSVKTELQTSVCHFLPSDPLQNSIWRVAVYSAPGLGIHDNDPHHFSRHHHHLATGQRQKDAGRWTERKDSCKNRSSGGNNSVEYVAALLGSSGSADNQHQRGPSSGSSCHHHQRRGWVHDICSQGDRFRMSNAQGNTTDCF